jgi:hypothetical protein
MVPLHSLREVADHCAFSRLDLGRFRCYSHLKKRMARYPKISEYPARTSSGWVAGNWPTQEDPIAGTAAPSGV